MDNAPELAWRLARREAYDSLSALVQAVDRSLKEPRAVQPPLQALEQLQAHCYQLLGQMTSVKIMLMMRRGQTPSAFAVQQMQETIADVDAHLLAPVAAAATRRCRYTQIARARARARPGGRPVAVADAAPRGITHPGAAVAGPVG